MVQCHSWGSEMKLPVHLQPMLAMLRHAYPHGLPDCDYIPLLVVLQEYLSARNLAAVVAELVDGETVVIENDAAAALSQRRPEPGDVKRVRDFLEKSGWTPEGGRLLMQLYSRKGISHILRRTGCADACPPENWREPWPKLRAFLG